MKIDQSDRSDPHTSPAITRFENEKPQLTRMNETMSEQSVADVFVELADTLVEDFDVIDVLTRLTSHCVELLGAVFDAGSARGDGLGAPVLYRTTTTFELPRSR